MHTIGGNPADPHHTCPHLARSLILPSMSQHVETLDPSSPSPDSQLEALVEPLLPPLQLSPSFPVCPSADRG